ncbi:MAG TPA: glycoside hydrolase family 9 protein [Bacteroidales bacterium]|nr:glycoside hydrolase family 9 protein [Bacteroidales bacterium]
MKAKTHFIIIAVAATVLTVAGCGGTGLKSGRIAASDTTNVILFNQLGYQADAHKTALIRSDAEGFDVIDAVTGKKVLSVATGAPEYWSFSGDTVRVADFTELTTPGTYRLCLSGSEVCSTPFRISDDVYSKITLAAVQSYYHNRSGIEITEEHGGKWARPAGHPDTVVLIHKSAASASRPEGTVISSPGGWYDAGDYNKYIVNSSITNYTLLLFYQLYPDYCRALSLNIPESGNDIPDLLDELLYNLRWMLTMQDPADGGVYHKLTNKDFGGFEMPDKAVTPRYVVQKSTQAALDFTAVMAMASRVFANDPAEEIRNLSVVCLEAASNAMKWAEKNPDVIYNQPADIKTGEYGGSQIKQEFFWATAELALAESINSAATPADGARAEVTQETVIPLTLTSLSGIKPSTPQWNNVEMLGVISLALSDNPAFADLKSAATALLKGYADELKKKSEVSPYRISLDFFAWGSNSDVANQAMLKLIAMKLTGDNAYLPSIQGDVDYILGRNATGYCFVTGFGHLPPRNIHHRPSGADGVAEPVPGFLVGGPNISVLNDCLPDVKRSEFPAASYTDSECSYSTNEICINWNAPLVFVLGAMDSRRSGK